MQHFSRGKAVAMALLTSYAMMLSVMAQEAATSPDGMVDIDAIEKQMEDLEKQKRELLNNKAAALAAREKQLEEERKAFEEKKAKEEEARRKREETEKKLRDAGVPAEMMASSGSGAASTAPT